MGGDLVPFRGLIVDGDEGTLATDAHVIARDAGPLDRFGARLAISGDRLLVGAYTQAGRGEAYLYDLGLGGARMRSLITASDGDGEDLFGIAVALDGDTAVVGASGDDDAADDAGAVYVYRMGR